MAPNRKRSKATPVAKETQRRDGDDDDDVWTMIMKNAKEIERDEKLYSNINTEELKKMVDSTFSHMKKGEDKLKEHEALQRKAGTTRSGRKRCVKSENSCHFDGKYVNKGIDDASEKPFDEEEVEFLEKQIDKMDKVNLLKFDHLRYLIIQVFLKDLKDIKAGKLKSQTHDQFMMLKGKSKNEMLSEVRTNLFTDIQRAYIYGLIQGVFETTKIDEEGNIKHREIEYNNVVMMTEIITRIVKRIHDITDDTEASEFIKKSWDVAYGYGED